MSETIQIQEQRLSDIVRHLPYKQLKFKITDEKDGRCILGALLSYYGWNGVLRDLKEAHYSSVSKILNRSHMSSLELTNRNNEGQSFGEIAQYLESIGK